MRHRLLVTLAGLFALGVPTAAPGQVVDVASRAPRFLYTSGARAAADNATVFTDASRAEVLRQKLSIVVKNVPVGDALREIVRRARLQLIYTTVVLPSERRVSLDARQITVAAALTDVLLDTGIDVVLTRSGQMTLVQRRTPAAGTDTGVVVGRVTDAKTRDGVAGAEIILDGADRRTSTGVEGRYRLTGIAPGNYTLTVRRLGYAKQSCKISVPVEHEDTVNFVLEPVAAKLEELVTTATGPQRRRDIGNAITTIRADSVLRTAPIRSLTDLLANRVPGLTVQHTSGAPGDPARLRLRGISSVMRGNDPVVIVDGVRVYSTQSEARSGNLTSIDPYFPSMVNTPAPSPIDQIDPNIIDKIEIFKGPSAATLYGADAANGVIVITTKKGKPGPTQWDARIEQGRTMPAGKYPTGYYRWGHIPQTGQMMFCPLPNWRCEADSLVKYQALNDPDMTILGRGQRTALSLSASGGSPALTYSVTGSYGNETGLLKLPRLEVDRFRMNFNREPPDWMRRPWELKTWSVQSNVAARLGTTADVTLSTTLSRSEQQRTALENQQARLAGTYVDKVTGRYFTPWPDSYTLVPDVPLNDYYRRTRASTITFTTGLTTVWRPRSWFGATGQAGLNVVPRDDESFLPGGLLSATDSGMLARGTGRSVVSTFGLQGTLRKPLKWGFAFETSLGANLLTTSTNDLVTTATGLVPGTSSLTGATWYRALDARVNTSVFGWYIEPRLTGQRISLSTGVRLDGGSAYGARLTGFGAGPGGFLRGLLALPKLNGSWVISEEPWFPFDGVFSSLRLRGTYGQAQVQPGASDRLRLYTKRVTAAGESLELDKLGNTGLRPERSTEFEGGFDADFLNSRASVELTLYRKVQADALMPVMLPGSVHGGGTIVQNVGNIRNTGMEITTRITPVQTPFLAWSAELNYQRNNNVLTKLGAGVDPNPRQGIVAGYPVGGRWSRPILGFADRNGDGVIDAREVQVGDSLVFMGRLLPAYRTSMFTNLAFFGGTVGITAGFSYDAGQTQIDETARTNWVLTRALVDPTTPLAQQAAVAVYDSTDYGVTQDVSTLRFNSLSVNYRAPVRVARLLHAQQLTLALQGANLGMHSTYNGKDPDVTAWSPSEHIVDTGQIPQPRTWQLMMSLRF